MRGRLRIPGARPFDASVEVSGHDLADEEIIDAALVLLREKHPGARWADARAAALTAGVTGDRRVPRWLFRVPLYLLLWTVAIAPVTYGIETAFRERVLVPACKDWGARTA